MDANGLNFRQLSSAAHWQLLEQPSGLEFDLQRRSLRLAHVRREAQFSDDAVLAEDFLRMTPQTRDRYGNRAWLDETTNNIIATGLTGSSVDIFTPDLEDAVITDLVMGYDDVLYIAINGTVLMQDRRDRWRQRIIQVPSVAGFSAWRLAADPAGGVWVLDRETKQLGRVSGLPLHKLAYPLASNEQPKACETNANPPRLDVLQQITWPDDEQVVALDCNERGELVLLSWFNSEEARIRLLHEQLGLSTAMILSGVTNPFSITWLNNNRVAVLLATITNEAPVYSVNIDQPASFPLGELYPLKKDYRPGPFIHGLDQPPHYPSAGSAGSHALHRLSFPFYSREGQALNDPSSAFLDGNETGHVWHRLFIEALIPDGCGIKIWLAATDKASMPEDILPEDWFEHRFGTIYQTTTRSDTPVAVWEPFPTELPHQPGYLPCEIEKDTAGLFSVLIQRSTRRVRNLSGRFLHVQVQLTGQGRNTPELFALRAYGSRFSYVDKYLPELYHDTLFVPDADEQGDATSADFLSRMVTNFEGVLTQIEDRIAQAYLVTEPDRVPNENMAWLASWIGYDLNQSLPEGVQRCLLSNAAELYRWHGTLRGLKLVLEIVSEGGISGGEIVVLEDFRLRRTFASIIGADLEISDDPLTTGVSISGNSFVGDTLFVGDENKKEFLALFNAELQTDIRESAAIDDLFDRLAHRITILVHDEVQPQDFGLIKRFAALETPAHVEFRVLPASHAFIVGMAALVGVDSYLAHRPGRKTTQVDQAVVGDNHFIVGPGALDARLQGYGAGVPEGFSVRPIAIAADVTAGLGEDIILDGSGSRAIGDRTLTRYHWNLLNKGN